MAVGPIRTEFGIVSGTSDTSPLASFFESFFASFLSFFPSPLPFLPLGSSYPYAASGCDLYATDKLRKTVPVRQLAGR